MAGLQDSIVCWNANSLNAAKYAELEALTAQDPLIIAVNEAKIPDSASVKPLPGYSVESKPFLANQSGTVVYVADRLSYQRRPDLERSSHVLAVQVRLPKQSMLILAVYVQERAGSAGRKAVWQSLEAAARTGLPFVAIGDYNAHHPQWSEPPSSSDAGEELEQLCADHSLRVLNCTHCLGEPTFHRELHGATTESVLDLAVTNRTELFAHFAPDHMLALHSDHWPMRLQLSARAGTPPRKDVKLRRYRTHAANWPLFEACLEDHMLLLRDRLPQLLRLDNPQESLNSAYDAWISTIQRVAEDMIGLQTIRLGETRLKLSQATLAALDALHAAQKEHYRRPNAASRAARIVARRAFTKLFRQEKQDAHERLCAKLSDGDDRSFWRHWKRLNPRSQFRPLSVSIGGQPAATEKEALDRLASYFAGLCKNVPRVATKPEEKTAEHEWDTDAPGNIACAALDKPFELGELKRLCKRVKEKSAAGPDELPPVFLRHLKDAGLTVLLAILNFSWQNGVLPPSWLLANITPIPKKGGNAGEPSGYRGISLTSVVCKLFEQLILARLEAHEPVGQRLSNKQAGFRRHYSTKDQLYRVHSAIQLAVAAGKQLPVCFVDISRAFDSCWHKGIMYKLAKLGITGQAWRWIKAFLSGRQLRVVNSGLASDWCALEAGTPQGAVLSPFLFRVFIDDIITACDGCDVALYADDAAFWPSEDRKNNYGRLQRTMAQVHDWCLTWRLQLNVPKTKLMIACGDRAPQQPESPLVIAGSRVEVVESYKYLGLLLHRNAKWELHGGDLLRRVRAAAFTIVSIIQLRGPPLLSAIRTLVIAVMTSTLSYGMPIYQPTPAHLKILDATLATPLRIALGLPNRGTSAQAVLDECGVPNSQTLLDREALSLSQRAQSLPPSHPTHTLWEAREHSSVRSAAARAEQHAGGKAGSLVKEDVLKHLMAHQHEALLDEKEATRRVVKPEAGVARYLLKDDKLVSVRRARLRFGMCSLNAEREPWMPPVSPDCPDCKGTPETAVHLVMHCPRYTAAREQCRSELESARVKMEMHVMQGCVETFKTTTQDCALAATGRFLSQIPRLSPKKRD
jgi:hypothetical protein